MTLTITKQRFIYLLLLIIPAGMVIAPIPFSPVMYYLLLIFMAGMALSKPAKINGWAALLIAASAASIVAGMPPSYFKPWPRLVLFTLLMTAVSPMIDNRNIYGYRKKLLHCLILLCSVVGVTGVFCFMMGINYMALTLDQSREIDVAGWFGGLAPHSMTLGPCGAIGTVSFIWIAWGKKKLKAVYLLFAFLCFLSTTLSASRTSLLATVVGVTALAVISYRKNLSKLIAIGILTITVLAIAYPTYERFVAPIVDKQESNERVGSTFSSREGRWAHRIEEFKREPIFGIGFSSISTEYTQEYDPTTGVVEPGSSWLAILSMTGLLGLISFLKVLFPTIRSLLREDNSTAKTYHYSLYLALIAVCCVTMCSEGYIFAGGNFFCLFFWLLLGVSYSDVKSKLNLSL